MSTVWQWLKYLGYHYDKNKTSHYTDGDARDNVVDNRNNSFLIDYFKAERRTHRWVQADSKVAIEIEKTDDTFLRNCSYDYQYDSTPNVWRVLY